MRRLFLILVMFILPLQLAWAAAAVHCQHESAPDSAHFGHHQHDHQHAVAPDADDGADIDIDADCAGCLGHGSVVVLALPALPEHGAVQGLAPRPLARLPAPDPEGLLRPPRSRRA